MLRRRKKFLEEGYCCVLCHDNIKETIKHLFFDCPATITRWFVLGITWEEDATIYQKLITIKGSFAYPFFMEVFMIGAWCLWNERNALIFDSKAPNFILGRPHSRRKSLPTCSRLNSPCTAQIV